ADAFGSAGQEVLLLEDGLLHDVGAAPSVLDGPPDRPVPGAGELLLPRLVRLEPLAGPGGGQAPRHVLAQPRADLLPERVLLGCEGEIHRFRRSERWSGRRPER